MEYFEVDKVYTSFGRHDPDYAPVTLTTDSYKEGFEALERDDALDVTGAQPAIVPGTCQYCRLGDTGIAFMELVAFVMIGFGVLYALRHGRPRG